MMMNRDEDIQYPHHVYIIVYYERGDIESYKIFVPELRDIILEAETVEKVRVVIS